MNFPHCNKSFLQLFVLSVLLFGNSILYAQDDNSETTEPTIKPKKALKQAKEFVRVEEYHHAQNLLEKVYAITPKDPEVNYYLGITHLHSFRRKTSLQYFENASVLENKFPMLTYYLAKAHHYNHNFDKAVGLYEKYRATLKNDKGEVTRAEIDLYIKQCGIGKKLVASPVEVEIFNLGNKVNTSHTEFAPIITADETTLIFTSRREDSMGNQLDPLTGEHYEDIYISKKDQNGEWGKPENMGSKINTENHDASIGLSPDGLKLYIYKDEKNNSGKAAGNIYSSDFKNGKWKVPKKMQNGINSSDLETHASITSNEKFLFFTSNRTDGNQGGMDIYMARRLPNFSWAVPENLGSVINTSFDEEAPFIDAEGHTLYFSSKGHGSMGGYDIFSSERDEKTGKWSKPKNLGYPINTADDDLFYVWSADGTRGYFSSSRDDSRGEQDIYMVSYPKREMSIIVLKGKVTNAKNKKPLAAIIEVVDNATQKVVAVSTSNAFNGQYSLFLQPNGDYGVRVKSLGYLFKSINIKVKDQFDFLELKENVALKPIGDNQIETLENIFFADDILKISSDPELKAVKELLESPKLKDYEIELAIHSDNQGDSILSIFKTRTLVEELRRNIKDLGISSNRLITKGYGFGSQFPLATNITQTGRNINDRIEYIVRKKVPKTAYKEIDYGADLAVQIFDPKDEVIDFPHPNTVGDEKFLDLDYSILFRTLDNTIGKDDEKTLDKIVEIMERFPDTKLAITGHTDNAGNEPYNLSLSERRASLIAQQLVFRGISKDRLAIKGMGSSKPVASNDDEAGRRLNSRVDFKPEIPVVDTVAIVTTPNENPLVIDTNSDSIATDNSDDTIATNSITNTDSIAIDNSDDTTTDNNDNTDDNLTTITNDQSNTTKTDNKNTTINNVPTPSSKNITVGDTPKIGKILVQFTSTFAFDSYELSDGAKRKLDKVAAYLSQHQTYKLEIGGHTDNIGAVAYNQWLGNQRAKAALKYLITKMENDYFITKSYGIENPILSNDTKSNRGKNRRVEFKIIGTVTKS